MLVTTHTTFALRCPQCGRLEPSAVSRFDFSGCSTVHVHCPCGYHKMTIGVGRGQVRLQVPCYLCDGVHFLYFSARDFWDQELKPISCTETDLQLGVLGPEEEVASYARHGGSELDRLLEDAAFADYFEHPEVMHHALDRIHTLSEAGNLRCICGNRKILVDIFPERLELTCPECGRHRSLWASSEEDLDRLDHLPHIVVGEETVGRRKGHKK